MKHVRLTVHMTASRHDERASVPHTAGTQQHSHMQHLPQPFLYYLHPLSLPLNDHGHGLVVVEGAHFETPYVVLHNQYYPKCGRSTKGVGRGLQEYNHGPNGAYPRGPRARSADEYSHSGTRRRSNSHDCGAHQHNHARYWVREDEHKNNPHGHTFTDCHAHGLSISLKGDTFSNGTTPRYDRGHHFLRGASYDRATMIMGNMDCQSRVAVLKVLREQPEQPNAQ